LCNYGKCPEKREFELMVQEELTKLRAEKLAAKQAAVTAANPTGTVAVIRKQLGRHRDQATPRRKVVKITKKVPRRRLQFARSLNGSANNSPVRKVAGSPQRSAVKPQETRGDACVSPHVHVRAPVDVVVDL
jgi:hypothetical protein